MESFWQKESNCVCVAFIKYLLLDKQLQRVFTIHRSGMNRFITLQDGKAIALSDREIRDINRQNGLTFRRPRDAASKQHMERIKQFAGLCFALLVRNMQLSGYEGNEYTQQMAIDTLVWKGVQVGQFHRLLGIKRTPATRLSLRNLPELKKAGPVLLYNEKHITLASGSYYEHFGEAVGINDEIPLLLDQPATSWFRLRNVYG
jgi:hypothetical protein